MWQHGEDCDQDMREHECRACGCHQFRTHKIRDPGEPAPTLSGLLDALGNADSFVRSTTIFKLEMGDPAVPGVLPKLADLATADPEPLVRIAAVEALRRLRASAAIPVMAEALRDRHPEVRRAAALALGDLLAVGDSVALAALTNHVDNHPRVGEAVAVALRKIQPNPGACWQVVVSNN
jgi:HEAT repeat protein